MVLAAGDKLGPYEILEAIGAGGMGEVYKARDTRLGRFVALKVLPSAFLSDPSRVHRFEQEGRATAALNHPNIVVLYDAGLHDGVCYIVSELLEGESLRERLSGAAFPVRKEPSTVFKSRADWPQPTSKASSTAISSLKISS